MKAKSTFLLGSILVASSFLNGNAYARYTSDAPKELVNFTESDFNSIHTKSMKTHALPKKILITALVLEARAKKWIAADSIDYKTAFKKIGLGYPEKIFFAGKYYNWETKDLPFGLVEKDLDFGINANIKVANLSCTACHSGNTFDSEGKRLSVALPGGANDRFNPEVYVDSLYKGTKKLSADWDSSYKLLKQIFPDTALKEKILLNTFIKSQIKKYIKDHASIDRATPFLNGGPGLTNGVASLKYVVGLDVTKGSDKGFTSIPSLGDRAFKKSLLYDGVYSIPNKDSFVEVTKLTEENFSDIATITALFTVPTMGQTPKKALKNIELVKENLIPVLKAYKTPAFPGKIDSDLAKSGFDVYNKNCMECHGQYNFNASKSTLASFPNKFVNQDEIGSDKERWSAVSEELVDYMRKSTWSSVVATSRNPGYVAPILEGLWATSPYLHNGSVPTLWELMNPELRPETFFVGDQSLDLKEVGMKNEKSSDSEIYDTRLIGRSNKGHESEFSRLSQEEKIELLEFLKTL